MPIYYNTTAPVAGGNNSITRTAKDYGIRDFLLRLNIQNPIKYPQYSTSINGSPRGGEPFTDTMVGVGAVLPQIPLTVTGLLYYTSTILNNQYKDMDPAAPLILSIDNTPLITPIFPQPPGTNQYPLNPDDELINKYGLLSKMNYKEYRKLNTIKNLYLDANKQIDVASFINLQPIQTAQQLPSYLDEYGGLNLGQNAAVQAADIIGSVLNGQGLGLAKGGIVTNYDIRASIVGRVLTATGLLNDTKLGVIGGQQLVLALANNAAFNVQQQLFGPLNVKENIYNIIKGEPVNFRADYKITVPTNLLGQIVDAGERILGFQLPKSYIPESGSIFNTENGGAGNIERANSMLEATGKGQARALGNMFIASLKGISKDNKQDNPQETPFRSGYSPDFKRGESGDSLLTGQKPLLYAFSDGTNSGKVLKFWNSGEVIPEINYNLDGMVTNSGFYDTGDGYTNSSTIRQSKATWTSNNGDSVNNVSFNDQIIADKKTLLGKTQKLFNNKGMKTIVSVKGDMTIKNGSQIQTAVAPGGGISKGSGVLSAKKFNNDGTLNNIDQTAEDTFCRVWTTYDRYNTVSKLIRNRGLNRGEQNDASILNNNWRLNYDGSVLDDNGFPKIAPYKDDDLTRVASQPKKYMFSIENLAWAGTPAANLLPVEQGPGDLLTGKFGRIMWFPPYDLTFSESSSVNLESTNFIGRGEPIYTYNNTERTGNLSFKIIIDHPSIMNAFAGNDGPDDEFIRSWFAGCVDLSNKWSKRLTPDELLSVKKTPPTYKDEPQYDTQPEVNDTFNVYFPNDISKIETIISLNGIPYEGTKFKKSLLTPTILTNNNFNGCGIYNGENSNEKFDDNRNFELNTKKITLFDGSNYETDYYNSITWNRQDFKDKLKQLFNDNPDLKFELQGTATYQGAFAPAGKTKLVNEKLAKNRAKNFKQWLIDNIGISDKRFKLLDPQVVPGAKYPQTGDVSGEPQKKDRSVIVNIKRDAKQIVTGTKKVIDKPASTDRVQITENVRKRFYNEANFFEKLKQEDEFVFDRIRQKIRYFHPAFHSMTPEGLNSRLTFLLQCTRQGATQSTSEPFNLAFGVPPVCILRIGDFYNTKIMMDNVSFTFEDQLWDLNPEGIGIQPMIANVTISFKYIGGSSLYSPINKLQNALSFNFFANTQVYDPRADVVIDSFSNNFEPGAKITRITNGTENQSELNYSLVRGMNPYTQSMGVLTDDELNNLPISAQIDQTKSADLANSTANQPQALPDNKNVKVTNFTADTACLSGNTDISFNLELINPSSTLSKDYKVSVTIYNDETEENYEIVDNPEWDLFGQTNTFGNYTFNLSDMTPTCTGLSSGVTYTFLVDLYSDDKTSFAVDTLTEFESNCSGTTPTVSTTTTINEKVNHTIFYSNTVNKKTDDKFLDDIHGAASSARISNDFSEQVGDELKKYNGVAVKNISMQTVYDTNTQDATTKLSATIYSTANNFSYKHFDARGSIGTLANQSDTFNRFMAQHTKIMDTFKSKNIMKIGDTKKIQINIDGTEYLYYETFYQWTD